jgi:3-oxoacyl-[acyl-carrier protein] reductase
MRIHGLDFGIAGRIALVCGSSAGLGRACAEALGHCGVELVLNGRTEDSLRRTAADIGRLTGARTTFVVGDVATRSGRARILEHCPAPDILVNNGAGPPTGDFRMFDETVWDDALRATMIAPIMMIRSVLDAMIARSWGRIINITSSAVKAPLPLLGLSNGARSGLTGFVAGLAREVAASGVTINGLLPGRFKTARLDSYIQTIADAGGRGFADAADGLAMSNPMKRFGAPEELGAACAFLASRQAAYITGQNILIDGGEFSGVL